MIVTCPECQRRYRIPLASLGEKGRTVRCSSCGHLWFVEPFTMVPGPAAPAPVEKMPVERAPVLEPFAEAPIRAEMPPAAAPARPQGSGRLLTAAGWVVLAALSGLVLVGLMGRDLVIARWPAALAAYQRLGLPVTLPLRLELADVTTARDGPTPLAALEVKGNIRNAADQPRLLPPLRLALHDERQNEIDVVLFDPPAAELAPGATAPFDLRVAAPPAEAKSVSITFGDTP